LVASNQVQGAGYSKPKVEANTAALQLETSTADLKLETDATALELEAGTADLKFKTDLPQETSKQERYSAD
jgi:hypothetical protein